MKYFIKIKPQSFLLILILFSFSQGYLAQTVITLNQPEVGGQIHKAKENVKFQVGYHYAANITDNLRAYIDELAFGTGLTTSGGLDPATFDGRTINTNLTVGTIKGSHSISPSGAASYSMPIKLSPGRNGMTPALSVNYNSQSGNGILGMGWHLGGISVISRVPRTIYNDGLKNSVSLTNNDVFALDGNRLIVANGGVYGVNGTTYATENETFNTIVSNGAIGSGPEWLQVESKNGLIFEYGNTADSKNFPNINQNSIISWYLNKVTDQYGNYYTYHYRTENNELLIDKIEYGGNSTTGLAPFNTVQFYYDLRQDKNAFDIADEHVEQNVVISQIKVENEGDLVRMYNFNYGYDIFTYLTEVIEEGSGGSSLNSTIFKYGEMYNTLTESTMANLIPSDGNVTSFEFFPSDYNGDGKTDLLGFSFGVVYGPNYSERTWLEMELFINTGNDTYIKSGPSIPFPPGFNTIDDVYPKQKGQIGNTTLQNVDFNGDGLSDIFFITPDGSGNQIIYPYTSTGIGLNAKTPIIINTTSGLLTRSLDVDGDGTTEILVNYTTGTQSFKYEVIFNADITDGRNFSKNYNAVFATQIIAYSPPYPDENNYPGTYHYEYGMQIYTPNPAYAVAVQNWWQLEQTGQVTPITIQGQFLGVEYDFSESFITDHDGDGKFSIENVKKYVSGIETKKIVLDYNGIDFAEKDHLFDLEFPGQSSISDQLFGDFNGDGKLDYIYTYQYSPWEGWKTNYGTLSSFTELTNNNQLLTPFQLYVSGNPSNVPAIHYVADVNGDGKSDIIEFESQTIVNVHYSNGLSFVKKSYPLTIPIDHDIDQIVFGDFNGDDKMDILVHKLDGIPQNDVFKVLYFEKEGKERLLHAVKDGFNNTTEFTYDYLTNNGIYTKGNSSNYPITDVQLPLPVVTAIKIPDGIGSDNITIYKYEEALLDRTGKGFLGFKKTISENNVTDIRTTSEYVLNQVFYSLSPLSLNTELMSGGQSLSLRTFNYSYIDLGNKRYLTYLQQMKSTDILTSFTTITNFSYDNSGNMYQSYTTKGNLETEEVYNTFGAHGSTIPASIENSSVTITRTGAPAPYQRSVQYIYNAQGSVIEKITDSGDANELSETYTYNTLGNQISLTLSGIGVNPRTSTNIYDSKGRFVVETKNSLNQSSFATYDSKWGVPLTATGIDGLTTTYIYNGFGTLISETTPDNIETTYDLDWDIGNTTITNSIYTNTITKNGSPTSIKWYDVFGRERQKAIDGFNQKVYQITTYDERGNIKTTTAPFYQAQSTPVIVTTNTYNVHNQIASSQKTGIATATNFVYTYAPNQITTTVTNPDLTTSSKTIDATGKIISATDAGGTLNYSYYASGLQKEIQLGGIAVNSMEYDLQGNKTILIDKNAGTTTYQYNAFGELIRQKDAKNNEYIMEYDVLGRITKKEEVSGSQIYNFTYVTTGNGINRIKKVIEQENNISEEYSYDGFGRITQLKETVDANPYNTDFEYDIYSNISAKIYPSGFRVENTYNQYGYLLKKMNGTDVIWEGSDMNAYGNYTNYSKSNGLLTGNNTYNNYGFLENKTTTGIQDLTVDFDIKNGNLFSRYDGIKGILEEFTYDNLNRLTQTEVNGTVQGTMSYSSNGNIQSKTAAGIYTYDNNKINAVVSASNPLGTISTIPQDITYTPFNSTAAIIEGVNELQLTYGPNEQRKKTELLINGSLTTTKYFLGDYEKNVDAATGDITELHYIAGGDGLAGIYTIKNGGAGEMFYTYTDHLGSILTLTDDAGTVVAEQNFDAWGKYRDAQTWATATSSGIPTAYNWLTRGYTGHEHLDAFNLINMNGRVYDPTLGRMLSVDNYVQSPLFTQSYNRYSYVLNNPLKYTDNSGEFIPWLAIGVYAAWTYLKGVNDNGGQWNPFGWGSTNDAGQANSYVFGISGNSSGVTSFTSGLTTGGGGSALNFNTGTPLTGIPGINFAEVDAERGMVITHEFGGVESNSDIEFVSNSTKIWKENVTKKTTFYERALTFNGTPYKRGGRSKSGVDCSGLICLGIGNNYKAWTTNSGVPRGYFEVSIDQTKGGKEFLNTLQVGDVLVFHRYIGHAGYYAGIINGSPRLYSTHGDYSTDFNAKLKYYISGKQSQLGFINVYREFNISNYWNYIINQ